MAKWPCALFFCALKTLILLLTLLLLLLAPSPVRADDALTTAVNSAFIGRTFDAGMHDIAHQRAIEIVTDWSHNQRREGTAEVLVTTFAEDYITEAVLQWTNSPDHFHILMDPSYALIGCAENYAVNPATGVLMHWVVCVMTWGPAPTPAPAPPVATPPANDAPVLLLPNAATQPRWLDVQNTIVILFIVAMVPLALYVLTLKQLEKQRQMCDNCTKCKSTTWANKQGQK